ncbi:MAG: SDR family NAD(P)-dependent oxidoreductase [Maricaulaceae bacterium]
MSEKVCAVVGMGPGNGAAYARRFAAEGYKVALLSRNAEALAAFETEIAGTRAFLWDAREAQQAPGVFDRIKTELGPVDVLLYNAGAGAFKSIEEASFEDFESAWRTNVLGLAAAAQAVIPDMVAKGEGAIVVSSATAALRGGAKFAPFASAKAAQRSLAQSMARQLGPQGVHVANIIIDGMIDIPRWKAQMPEKPDDFWVSSDGIADAAWTLVNQPKRAWTFELDLRPYGERW